MDRFAKFPQRLKELRLKNKLSQAKFAQLMGVSDTQYQRYEYGENEPTIGLLFVIGLYFEVSVDWLLGLTDDPERKHKVEFGPVQKNE